MFIFVGRGRRHDDPKNIEFLITFGGVFFLCSFSSIATKRNQKMPPKRKGVQHFGFKIVFGGEIR